MEALAAKLGQAAAEQIDRIAYEALKAGTNVTWPDYDLPLIICGTKCCGRRATAADPLAQFQCECCNPHYEGEANKGCGHYDPRELDCFTAGEMWYENDTDKIRDEWK